MANSKRSKHVKKSKRSKRQNGGANSENAIIQCLTEFHDKLKEKKLLSFWMFENSDIKIKKTQKQLEELFQSKIEKYKNQHIAKISIFPAFLEPNDHTFKDLHIYIFISIKIYKITKTGELTKSPVVTTTIFWEEIDFKTSKPTLKLIEQFVDQTFKENVKTIGPYGSPLNKLVIKLQKKIDWKPILKPLNLVC